VREVVGHLVRFAEEEVAPAALGLLHDDRKAIGLYVEMFDPLQNALREDMELVVVTADDDEDPAVIRADRVIQTGQLRVVSILG
jgi:hypothetical protein